MIAYKKFYHCKRKKTDDESIVEFEAPIKKYGNYQPLSGYVDTVRYGESIDKMWRLQVNSLGNENEYAVGDVMYLDGDYPDTTVKGYEYGDGANAKVIAVKIGYKSIQVELESIIERND